MDLVAIEKGRVTVNPHALTIQEFSEIWNSEKDKDSAIRKLSFVFYLADYKSPYRRFEAPVREVRIKKDLGLPPDWQKDEKVTKAIAKFQELQVTPSMALLLDAEEAILKLRSFITSVNLNADEKGTKVNSLLRIINSLSDTVKSMSVLKIQVEKELAAAQQIRGRGQLSSRELPPDNRTKSLSRNPERYE